jgi:serine/threonine-protein kinase
MLAEHEEQSQRVTPVPAEERGFGRYQLLYRFASGGMASIYLGRFPGPDGFEKLVAIKRIHEHLTTLPQFVAMFKDEARLAARIAHPNVVQVLELGLCNGTHFIAMEYVEGESLTALLRRKRIPYPVAARIIADALAGLHAAHELKNAKGELLHLVHRDLSPSNILVSYEGAVKVVDFGVARARGNLSITDAGTVKGKFAYMSPEQVKNLPLDRRSDLFSMGTLLYESSVHRRLFHADNEAATVAKILECDVPPPRSVREDYPQKLEAIVKRALSKLPGERYPNAKEMQLALEEYIFSSGAPVLPSTVGDLMREVFADQIVAKKQLLLGEANPQVLASVAAEASGVSLRLGSGPEPEILIAPEAEEREDTTLDLEPDDLVEVMGTIPPVPGMPPVPPGATVPPVVPGVQVPPPENGAWQERPSAVARLDLQDLSRLPSRRVLFLIGGGGAVVIALVVTLLIASRGDKQRPVLAPDAGAREATAVRRDAGGARSASAPDLRAADARRPDLPRPDLPRPDQARPRAPDARTAAAVPDLRRAAAKPVAKPAPKPKKKSKKGLFGNPYEN